MKASRPKQFIRLKDQALYLHSLRPFIEWMNQIVVVVPKGYTSEVKEELKTFFQPDLVDRLMVIEGGDSRQESVRLGLESVLPEIDYVLVHDAARPRISSALINRVMEGTRKQGACIPAVFITDTVKLIDSGYVTRTLERESLARAQTPQGFKVDLLKEAYHQASLKKIQGTDEASLVERIGVAILVVEGESANIKITRKDDLENLIGSSSGKL